MVNYSGTRKRATLGWEASDGNTVVLTTRQVVKLLGVPQGYHPLVYKIKGYETALSSAQQFWFWADPNIHENAQDLGSPSYPFITTINGGGTDGEANIEESHFGPGWKSLMLITDANDSFAPEDVGGPYHVYDSMLFLKAETATWIWQIEYELVPGAMRWLDEWAALLADKYNAPLQDAAQSAGIRYHQIGDYYQINKRTYS